MASVESKVTKLNARKITQPALRVDFCWSPLDEGLILLRGEMEILVFEIPLHKLFL